MSKPIRHEVHIPRVVLQDDNTKIARTVAVVPLPSGIGRVRTGGVHDVVASIDPTVKNPVFDLSANEQLGIICHIGAIPYGYE